MRLTFLEVKNNHGGERGSLLGLSLPLLDSLRDAGEFSPGVVRRSASTRSAVVAKSALRAVIELATCVCFKERERAGTFWEGA